MKFSTLALVLASAQADFAEDASALASCALSLSSIAQPWDRQHGLMGVLNIQFAYASVSSAVEQLAESSEEYNASRANVQAIQSLGAAVPALLEELCNKAADIQAMGVRQIAANDINDMLVPTEEIVSNIYRSVMHDCGHLSQLSRPFYAIESAFYDAATAFGAQAPRFPDIKCMR